MRLMVKPLSMNELFRGRRFRTRDYDSYELLVSRAMRGWEPELYDKMRIVITVGLSNRNADLDNCLKGFIDIVQKRLGFNDSRIYRIEAQKTIVPKGEEFVDLEILPFLG